MHFGDHPALLRLFVGPALDHQPISNIGFHHQPLSSESASIVRAQGTCGLEQYAISLVCRKSIGCRVTRRGATSANGCLSFPGHGQRLGWCPTAAHATSAPELQDVAQRTAGRGGNVSLYRWYLAHPDQELRQTLLSAEPLDQFSGR